MSSERNAPDETDLTPVRFAIRGRKLSIALLTVSAFVGGFTEALFLVIVTRSAFAITAGNDEVGLVAGKFLSVNATLTVALIVVAVRLGLSIVAGWLSAKISTASTAEAREQMARAFLNSSWSVQQAERSGSLQELLTAYSGQVGGLAAAVAMVCLYSANLTAMIGLAIAVDPFGALMVVFCVAVLALFLRPLRSAVRRRAGAANRANLEFATSLSEVSQLGMELHVFHAQEEAQKRVDRLIEDTRYKSRRLIFLAGIASPIYSSFAYLALLGALGVVATSNSANLTSLGAVMLVMLRSLSYGQALQSSLTTVASNSPAVATLQERLKLFSDGRRHDGGSPIGAIGTIRAENVSFEYTTDQPVLSHISFVIENHEIVGIVGPSGGGKSTLVELLLGLRDPDSGSIQADDRDIAELSKAEWARRVTFVPQAAHLIAGTVADNIRFLRVGVSDDDVQRAARLAHLHQDVIGFPEGYERQVGEHGGHLSGGQQQRLCIARALVEQPDLLILDEPTSALDVSSEHLIRTTLLDLKEHMTVIVIAHRLSTLDICGRIMVIQGGEMKGFDTPTNLESSSDFYREALVLSGMR